MPRTKSNSSQFIMFTRRCLLCGDVHMRVCSAMVLSYTRAYSTC